MKPTRLWLFALAYLIVNYAQAQVYIILAREPREPWKYYDHHGKSITDKRYPKYYAFTEDGFGLVGEGEFTILNRRGEEIKAEIPVGIWDNHHYIKAFYSDGLLVTKQGFKFGCLDTTGHIAIAYKYRELTEFIDGYAIGKVKRSFFVLNKKGEETMLADSTAADVRAFCEGRAAYANGKDKWGFVDTEGKIAVAPQFNRVGNFHKGLAWARNDAGLIGFIDRAGQWVIKPRFSTVRDFDVESGLAMVKTDTWMYIDTEGKQQPFSGEVNHSFSEGLTIGKKDKQVGFMDTHGDWAVAPQFDAAEDFDHGLAWVRQGDLWGLINKAGQWVVKPRFEAKLGVTQLK